MTLDRDQIKRDAEETIRTVKPDDSYMADDLLTSARHCLALLTELEQADKERDLYQRNWYGAEREVRDLRASLAKTPALVEAVKSYIEAVDSRSGEHDGGIALQVTYRQLREALAAWEQNT